MGAVPSTGWLGGILLDRSIGRLAPAQPGIPLAGWAAMIIAGAVLIGLRQDLAAAIALLLATLTLPLARNSIDQGPHGHWGTSVFLRQTAEVGLATALLMVAGWMNDTDTSALWPAWLAAFPIAARAYDQIVTEATGVRIDESDWIRTLRLHPADVPAWIAVYLLIGRPIAVLWAAAAVSITGFLAAAIHHAMALRALDRAESAGPGHVPRPNVPRWKTLSAAIGRSGDASFWGIWCGQSVSFLVHLLVFRAPWATPNRITIAAAIAGFAAAALAVVDSQVAVIAAVVLMQLRNGFDALDGQVARLRGSSSRFGSWFDKLSDTMGWAPLFAATAVCAGRESGQALSVLIPLVGAIALSFQGVTFWLDKRSGVSPSIVPRADIPFWHKCLIVLPRFPLFEEPDYYLWLSLALLLDNFGWLVVYIAIAFGIRVIVATVMRTIRAARFTPGEAT